MINLLRKIFIKDYKNIDDKNVRLSHGILASSIGIITNAIIFIFKLVVGLIIMSVSIIADAVNNLSDFINNSVSLIGFKVSKKKPDFKHPFGYERVEYIAGLIVSVFIIFIGGILVITSISKIIYYQSETYNNVLFYVTLGILSCSILLKIFQAYSYNRFSKLISSLTLKANFIDTISDIISTTFIMIALIIDYVLSFNGIIVPFSIDGVLGIVVSLFIIFNGIKLLIEETRPLIGAKFNQKYVDELISVIKSNDKIINYHDIMYHNYGENKCYMTVHLEIDNKYSLDEAHNIADQIEYEVKDKYGIELTSHIDPVNLNDQELADIKNKIITYLNEINENITIHDVRIIRRDNKHLILFDMNTPYDYEDINIKDKITKLFENKYEFKINIEHPYY